MSHLHILGEARDVCKQVSEESRGRVGVCPLLRKNHMECHITCIQAIDYLWSKCDHMIYTRDGMWYTVHEEMCGVHVNHSMKCPRNTCVQDWCDFSIRETIGHKVWSVCGRGVVLPSTAIHYPRRGKTNFIKIPRELKGTHFGLYHQFPREIQERFKRGPRE